MSTQKNGKTQTDPLGYDVYARTLWTRIRAALNKDLGTDGQTKPLGDDPLVVGIFGEWGAGKSHLLGLIYELAQQHMGELAKKRSAQNVEARGEGFEITVPVFFQPWKYEHEEHLHVPLLMHIIDAYAEVAVKAQTSDEAGDQLLKEYFQKAKPWLGLTWRRVLRPAAESFAGQFALKLKLAHEIEELANSLNGLVTQLQKEREEATALPAQASQDGHYFYRWHKVIQQLTRPWQFPELFKDEEGKPVKLDGRPRINFVVFIDDLDRCLPEKAVQTLELIKTVFNVESFAFVLALDDEVIERGIGHRYKDYELQDKKPKMPITGFEYLEKIVHLPFRLPELTFEQATNLVRIKEQELEPAPDPTMSQQEQAAQDKRLFIYNAFAGAGTLRAGESIGFAERKSDHFWQMMVSFDHYVPRKLIRSVETLYQISRIASERGKPLSRGESGDSQVLFALILLQLFQPELFRLVRRKEASLGSFLGAFLGEKPFWVDDQEISEVALWQWAVGYPSGDLGQKEMMIEAPRDWMTSITFLATVTGLNAGSRYLYQQVRLPLAQRLVEHMQVERHAFNPFKWAKALAALLGEQGVRNLNIRNYTRYLSEQGDVAAEAFTQTSTYGQPEATVTRSEVALSEAVIDNIYDRMVSKDLGMQAELRKVLEPYQGQVFDEASSRLLLQKLKVSTDAALQILQGLADVAPHIHPERDGKAFWALVQDCGITIPEAPNTVTPEPAKASLYLDVRSMLGQDHRFDRAETTGPIGQIFKPLYLLKNCWNGNNEEQEPIPGFVRIPAGTYPVGDPEGHTDNPKGTYKLAHDIYMGRMPVTVDQFGAFVADGGYGENESDSKARAYWDDQGWAWRHNTTSFQYATKGNVNLPRSSDLRHQPWNWTNQQRVGCRAVNGVTWFEARAYARWLNAQLKARSKLEGRLRAYGVSLPNEWQWEIAARAQWQNPGAPKTHWPSGDEESDVPKQASVNGSDNQHTSVPGCFAPNATGLLYLADNVWEWQDGLYRKGTALQTVSDTSYQHLPKSYQHALINDRMSDDGVSIRAYERGNMSQYAMCSHRHFVNAAYWSDNFGFRVMLSHSNTNSET